MTDRKLYRIRRPSITKVAVVARGAAGHKFHLLKQDETAAQIVAPLLKAQDSSWTVAYSVVAEPGHVEGGGIDADGKVAKDASGATIADVWERDEIRAAAHSFAANGGLTTNGHFSDERYGHWCESYLAPVDHVVNGQAVKEGSWVLAFAPTREGRAAIDAGELTGFSVEGDAVREPVLHSAPGDDELLEVLAAVVVAKGIGSTVPEPLGTGALWNTPGLKLPAGIGHMARDMMQSKPGMTRSHAIATAVAAVKQGCATGRFGNATLKPETRAKACKVAAEWEAAKAKARAT